MLEHTTAIRLPSARASGLCRAGLLLAALVAGCHTDPLPELTCPAARCGDACVDLASDPRNCGACGHACPAGELCAGGACSLSCGAGTTACAGSCVSLQYDPANCGACGQACPAGQVCSKGACGVSCGGGTSECSGRCVDPASDRANCGGCGHVCQGTAYCDQGTCKEITCGVGTLPCGPRCVDPQVDPANCGACGHACDPGSLCLAGACALDCGVGRTVCGQACADLQVDVRNCGACGQACAPGDLCQDGRCVIDCGRGRSACNGGCYDLATSNDNCGMCGVACTRDEACMAGACQCQGGKSHCMGSCVDLATDAKNCGACGTTCGAHQSCIQGACACDGGLSLCQGACVDLASDGKNCGACGVSCGNGKVCYAGICSLPFSPWRMLGNDAQHSGNNGAEAGGPPAAKPAWTASLSMAALAPAVSEDGRVFVTAPAYFGMTNPVWALDAVTGKQLWSYNFGNVFSVGFPSVSAGMVYVPQCNHAQDTHVWAFDARTGVQVFSAPMAAQWENYWAPLVAGGRVYSDGGGYGGLYGFDALTGAQAFFLGLEQYDQWSPAWFGGTLYSFVAGNFRAHDPAKGTELWKVAVNWNWAGWSMYTAPVFGAQYGYVIAPPNLYAIDPQQKKLAWTANGTFSGMAAVADNVVYAITQGNLQARDATTGAFLWSYAADGALAYPPVITPKYVYVASPKHSYAVDPAKHDAAWTVDVGGWLSVAAAQLFIAGNDGTLGAYPLQ